MGCQYLELSPSVSAERRKKAENVLGRSVVTKIIGLALYWLGVKRPVIASELGIPENSLRTTVRVLLKDGLSALEDRRRSYRSPLFLPPAPSRTVLNEATLRVENESIRVFGGAGEPVVTLPAGNRVQSRVVLLSLVNSGVLSPRVAGEALDLSAVHVRTLAERLARDDVEGLLDKRRGRPDGLVLTPEMKAEIVLQCSANALTGKSTASRAVATDIGERTGLVVSDRTLRHCLAKLGLRKLTRELPKLIDDIKRGSRA